MKTVFFFFFLNPFCDFCETFATSAFGSPIYEGLGK
jgi:hypothetical protein